MPKQMAFHVDTSVCMNCKACEIVCKDKNNLPVGVQWRRVIQYGGGTWVARGEVLLVPENIFTYSVSIACMHCAKPKCLEACPAEAIVKRSDGIVWIDPKKCQGRRLCEDACPYGAPQFHAEKGIMTKCDFCQDLLARGQNPACVDACSMRALHAGPLDELRARYGLTNAIEPLPLPKTGPSIVITPHRHAQPSGKGTGSVIALPVKT
jgi:anaerobic dimethyl sulfoxide reductase subunit B (iron-sulfur subunit)